MQKQCRLIEIEKDSVLAQQLDSASVERLRVDSPKKFVEHEILVVELKAGEQPGGSGSRARVLSSRIDPSFLGINPPRLEERGKEEFEIEDGLTEQELDQLEEALDLYRSGAYTPAANGLRAFLRTHPLHIDSYHHLGSIEWERNKLDRARKYFETGYRIGLLSLPKDFKGSLPWGWLGNRPFLRAAHGYGLALDRQKRVLDACDVFEWILKLNPKDNLGIRLLLPEVYLNAKAPAKARALLEETGPDGMNLYTLCLLEILDGRRREALRWLCRAVAHNPYVPNFVVSQETFRVRDGDVAMGSREEAADYLQRLIAHWRRTEAVEFLHRLLAPGPFRNRLDKVFRAQAELEHLPVGEKRSALVRQMFSIFAEESIPDILSECHDFL